MASDMEMRWGCKVTQWKRKKIERQKQKVKSNIISNRKQLGRPFIDRDRERNDTQSRRERN